MARKLFRTSRRPRVSRVPMGPWTQGVNQRDEPHLLEFSEMSASSNVIVDEFTGRLSKRPGTLFRKALPTLVEGI